MSDTVLYTLRGEIRILSLETELRPSQPPVTPAAVSIFLYSQSPAQAGFIRHLFKSNRQ